MFIFWNSEQWFIFDAIVYISTDEDLKKKIKLCIFVIAIKIKSPLFVTLPDNVKAMSDVVYYILHTRILWCSKLKQYRVVLIKYTLTLQQIIIFSISLW